MTKQIHYIWLSGQKQGFLVKKCIASWKRQMPDYEIRCWTLDDFDTEAFPPFVKQALEREKWAFASDYLRMYILEKCGGIYLDSDIFLLKPFDRFTGSSFFSFIEYHREAADIAVSGLGPDYLPKDGGPVHGICIQAAFLGSEPGCRLARDIMDFYAAGDFSRLPGDYGTDYVAPDVYAMCAVGHGFRYKDEEQMLDGGSGVLFPSKYLGGAPKEMTRDCFGVHLCVSTWKDRSKASKMLNDFVRCVYTVFLELISE